MTFSVFNVHRVSAVPQKSWRITLTLPRCPLWYDLCMCLLYGRNALDLFVCQTLLQKNLKTEREGRSQEWVTEILFLKGRLITTMPVCDYFIREKVTDTTNCNYSEAIPEIWH